MAVHCGVCGTRLYDATENEGSFQVNVYFTGWSDILGHAKITDTCSMCASVLRDVVTEAANKIVEANRSAVEALRAEIKAQRDRQAKYERDKAQFESDWAAKNAAKDAGH